MRRLLILISVVCLVAFMTDAESQPRPRSSTHRSYSASRSGTHHRSSRVSSSTGKQRTRRSSYSGRHITSGRHRSSYSPSAARAHNGKIKRSSSAKHEFMKRTGYPHGRPGYVIDHIVPLSRGGSDSPGNMQWQTKAEAKAKDKWERKR